MPFLSRVFLLSIPPSLISFSIPGVALNSSSPPLLPRPPPSFSSVLCMKVDDEDDDGAGDGEGEDERVRSMTDKRRESKAQERT